MKTHLLMPFLLAATILTFEGINADAQEKTLDTIPRIESKDTLTYRPLFIDESPAQRTIRLPHNSQLAEPKMQIERNGDTWKVFVANGLEVMMNVRYLKHYGKYYRIDLYIQNNTDSPVSLDFGNTSVTSRQGAVKMFTKKRFLNRIQARMTAKTIGWGIGTMCVTLVTATIVRGDPDDSDSFGEYLLRDIGGTVIEEAGYIATMAIADREAKDMARISRNSIGYLTDYTISPDHAILGHAYAKYKPGADSIEITLPVGNNNYVFNWNTTSLVEITEDSMN